MRNNPLKKPRKHVYFFDLRPENLPQSSMGKSRDVISWYLQSSQKLRDIESIMHSAVGAPSQSLSGITIDYQPSALSNIIGYKSVIKYGFWAQKALLISIIDMLRGRWWHALLLNQAAISAQARLVPQNTLAEDYLFHNSNWIYRPMWTYEVEKRGANVTFYFYSTNCESFKKKNTITAFPYGWSAMSWPRYLVWDNYQESFVRSAVGLKANVSIVGNIWFSASDKTALPMRGDTVAVFDVQPLRSSLYKGLGLGYEYYTPELAINFIKEVKQVLDQLGLVLALKRKREIGNLMDKQYRRFLQKLEEETNVLLLDPGIAANDLIEKCCAVISVPFTSTAIIGESFGKPSVYYDPSRLLDEEDQGAHGIRVIQDPVSLHDWLGSACK